LSPEPYHKYVFDTERRRFVGQFEAMYRAEETEGFDSWRERDLRDLRKRLSHTLLDGWNFSRILEVGCGKGTFTQLPKKGNNTVIGVDLSETAIRRARASFPDIDFRCMDIAELASLGGGFDLVVVMATLAYVAEWRCALATIAGMTRYVYVAEYVPRAPIGFVKSVDELVAEVEKHCHTLTKVVVDDTHCLLFAEARRA